MTEPRLNDVIIRNILLLIIFLAPTFLLRPLLLYSISNKVTYAYLFYFLLVALLFIAGIMRAKQKNLYDNKYLKALQYGALLAVFPSVADLGQFVHGVNAPLYFGLAIAVMLISLGLKKFF